MTVKTTALTLLTATTILAGCTMIPDYMRPDFAASNAWNDIPAFISEDGAIAAQEITWENYFHSPQIRTLVETALENNRDLRMAALNVAEARALYRVERADLFPNVNAAGTGRITRTSDNSSLTGNQTKAETYEANIGAASYEIDVFGRLQSLNESALNTYLATEEAEQTIRTALIAEIANTYIQWLADQKLLALAKKTLSNQQETHRILLESMKNGIATRLDVARATTAIETARVNIQQYKRAVALDQSALILLLGVKGNEFTIPQGKLADVSILQNVTIGLPSEVILARPDVRQAEYELLSDNADIGAARAAFFPTISLTGAFGFASDDLSDLFESGSFGAWNFAPQITVPIFEGGRNKANLDIATIRKERSISNYEKTIQTAFKEVSDSLIARKTLATQMKAQKRLTDAAGNVYKLSDARYKEGVDGFLSVLDAQREFYAAEKDLIAVEQQRLTNMVDLYKVLGGR